MLHSIAYISTANDLSQFEVNELMHTAKLKNDQLNITGILLFSDNNFFQIIEGDHLLIHELFEKIKQDTRHSDIITIFNRTMPVPFFTSFQNNYMVISRNKDYPELQQFLETLQESNPQGSENINYLAHKFMKFS